MQISFEFLKSRQNRSLAMSIYQQLDETDEMAAESKRSLIESLGKIFERDGVKGHEISARLTETIGDIVEPRWIRTVASKHGWTDPSKNTAAQQPQEDSSDSLNTLNPKSAEYSMRYHYAKIFLDIEKLAKMCREEILKDYDEVTDPDTGEVTHRMRDWSKLFESVADKEAYFKALGDMFYNIQETCRKCLDSRQSVLPLMLFPFLAKIAITNIKHFASRYFVHVKNVVDITSKKATQFMTGIDTVSDLLGAVRMDAWQWNAIELKCPECKKHDKTKYLRVRMYIDGTWDFVCPEWRIHEGMQGEMHFSHEMLDRRMTILRRNHGNAAAHYCEHHAF